MQVNRTPNHTVGECEMFGINGRVMDSVRNGVGAVEVLVIMMVVEMDGSIP